MKYKVLREIAIQTSPVTVEIVDGQYVRGGKATRYKVGDTIEGSKLKKANVPRLISLGAIEEVADAR